VAVGLLVSGHRLDLVTGVPGLGKTTTLAAVRDGFESAGYTVLGTATSGQGAKNLGEAPGWTPAPSPRSPGDWSTTTLELSTGHVLILDEGAMTSDVDLARLLTASSDPGQS